MGAKSPSVNIILLEDEPSDKDKILKLKSKIQAAFNQFYSDTFKAKKGVKFDVELKHAFNLGEFRELLFKNNSLTKVGETCILFILDYYFSNEGSERKTNLTELNLDGMPFPRWLNVYFPAIPRILLTVADSKDILMNGNFKYINKDILNDPDAFLGKLKSYFRDLWTPEYWKELYNYAKNKPKESWHTPGHNRGNAFLRSNFQRDFYEDYGDLIFKTDLSVSVKDLGDLSEPNLPSCLADSQIRSAIIFGAKETFYVTNGTSTSNKALLMTLLKPGEIVLLDRNCHKSVHQAVVMSEAIPVYLGPAYNKKLGVWFPISMECLEKFVKFKYPADIKPRMLILTTCSYEGILYPISDIKELCERYGILFYSDEAWAPYLRFHPYYVQHKSDGNSSRYNALDGGAHFVVQSTHKALAAFSQASMIHISSRFKQLLEGKGTQWEWLRERFNLGRKGSYDRFKHDLQEILRYWHSTSPHYPMLASLDRAGIQMSLEGTHLLEERLRWVDKFEKNLNSKTGGCLIDLKEIVGNNNLKYYPGYKKDPLKIVIGFKGKGVSDKVKEILKKNNIQYEKISVGCIEFLVTIGTFKWHIENLFDVLKKHAHLLGCPKSGRYKKSDFDLEIATGQTEILPRKAALSDAELVELNRSKNRISAQMLVPYPPGIPVFLPGIKITEKMIRLVEETVKKGSVHDVHGLYEDREKHYVRVIKRESLERIKEENKEELLRIQKIKRISRRIENELQKIWI